MPEARSLAEVVANRRWQKRYTPFPHVVAHDLFVSSMASEIDAAVREVVDSDAMNAIGSYDASGSGLRRDVEWPLRIFVTQAWRELISRAVGVETVPYVSAGIHHHAIGGKSGRPHNDLNPEYFPDVDAGEDMVLQDGKVDHKSGEILAEGIQTIRRVRAISILYYTANPAWHAGDGGETGLYERRSDPVNRPAVAVAPVNNTLVAFETTPNSFHSFISNRVSERNSVTMWLYRSDEVAVDRWGERTLERWSESPPAPAEDDQS